MMRKLCIIIILMNSANCTCPENCRCKVNERRSTVNCFNIGHSALHNISANVTLLQFSLNKIKRITTRTFKNFTSLQHIVLSQNEIDTIENGALNMLHRLERLDLASNNIQYFPWDFMRNATNLRTLVLENNFIRNIPDKESISRLKQLQSLRIDRNNFECSCDAFPFANWIRNNARIRKVTVPKAAELNCRTALGWMNMNLMDVRKNTGASAAEDGCNKPVLNMYSVNSEPDKSEALSRKIRQISNESLTDYDLDTVTPLPLRAAPPLIPMWALNSQKDTVYFAVVESMKLEIVCNVTNRKELDNIGGFRLKMAVINKDPESVDVRKIDDWLEQSKITFESVKKDTNNNLGVVCLAESMSGTVVKSGRIRVFNMQDETPIPGTTTLKQFALPQNEADKVEIIDPQESTDKKTSAIFEELSVDKESHFVEPTLATILEPTCWQNYSNSVVILQPNMLDGNVTQYRYSYGGVVNITMNEDKMRGRVLVYITSTQQDTLFLCPSDKSASRRWIKLFSGTRTRYIVPFVGESGYVCLFSTRFNTEVCGRFTGMKMISPEMTVMIITGCLIMSTATLIMAVCSIRNIHRRRAAKTMDPRRTQNTRSSPEDFLPYGKADKEESIESTSRSTTPISTSRRSVLYYSSDGYIVYVDESDSTSN